MEIEAKHLITKQTENESQHGKKKVRIEFPIFAKENRPEYKQESLDIRYQKP